MQIFRNENGRVGALDVLLGLAILGSVGFIAYSFLGKPASNNVGQSPALSADPVVVPQNSVSLAAPTEAGLPGVKWQNLHSTLKSIGDSEWSNLTELSRQIAPQSNACVDQAVSEQRALAFWDMDLARRVSTGDLDFVVEPTGLRCFRQGLKLGVLRYSTELDEKFVSFLGGVEVVSVFTIPARRLPDMFLSRAGISRAEMDEALKLVSPPGRKVFSEMTLIRIKPAARLVAPSEPLAHIVFAPVGSDKIAKFLQKFNKFRVIDLRTEAERASAPIAGALLTPYQLSGGNSVFSWDVTNKDLQGHEFNLLAALAAAKDSNLPILIVGREPKDGRPVWALRALIYSGFLSGYWYLDGGSSLKEAIDSAQFAPGFGVIPFD
jgi:hypothetical protein